MAVIWAFTWKLVIVFSGALLQLTLNLHLGLRLSALGALGFGNQRIWKQASKQSLGDHPRNI